MACMLLNSLGRKQGLPTGWGERVCLPALPTQSRAPFHQGFFPLPFGVCPIRPGSLAEQVVDASSGPGVRKAGHACRQKASFWARCSACHQGQVSANPPCLQSRGLCQGQVLEALPAPNGSAAKAAVLMGWGVPGLGVEGAGFRMLESGPGVTHACL